MMNMVIFCFIGYLIAVTAHLIIQIIICRSVSDFGVIICYFFGLLMLIAVFLMSTSGG